MQRNPSKKSLLNETDALPGELQGSIFDFLDNKSLASLSESNKHYHRFFKKNLNTRFKKYLEKTPGITSEQFFRCFCLPELKEIKNTFTNWCDKHGIDIDTLEFNGTAECVNLGLMKGNSSLFLYSKGKERHELSEKITENFTINI